jgi:hypothetical protein
MQERRDFVAVVVDFWRQDDVLNNLDANAALLFDISALWQRHDAGRRSLHFKSTPQQQPANIHHKHTECCNAPWLRCIFVCAWCFCFCCVCSRLKATGLRAHFLVFSDANCSCASELKIMNGEMCHQNGFTLTRKSWILALCSGIANDDFSCALKCYHS